MTIYPIIVTYNGLKWIDRCLGSLRSSTVPVHTIVIDNASSDGTADYVAQHYPEVELIRSNDNLGFGKGNNVGLQRALDDGAHYVFLLNQDAWIEPDTIERLVAVQSQNPDYGILSPVHLNYDDNSLEEYFKSIIGEKECPGYISDLYLQNIKDIYNIQFVHAAAWLISKDCLMEVGGFNPIFPHYCEDLEYINRVKYWKFKIGMIPLSIVHHWGTHGAMKKDLNLDFYFQYYFLLVDLLSPFFKSSTILIIKTKMSIDKLSSAILFRRWKEITIQLKLICKMISKFQVYRSNRTLLKRKGAFLKSAK